MYNKKYHQEYRARNLEKIRAEDRERNKRPDRIQATKECRKKKPELYRARNRKQAQERYTQKQHFKSVVKLHNGCLNPDCKWVGKWEPALLQFHHTDPATKLFNIGAGGASIKSVMDEMKKCTLVCANCHAMITWCGLNPEGFKAITFPEIEGENNT